MSANLTHMIDKILEHIEAHGYAVTDNALSSDDLAVMNDFINREKNTFTPAKVGQGAQRVRNESVRGDYTLWLDPKAPSNFLQSPTLLLGQLIAALNQRFYFGIKEFEYHFAYYPAGYFYQKHLDTFEKDSSRTISFIFYLNEEWTAEDGGELVMYQENGKDILETVVPVPGRLVIFLSREFPHEVKACRKERRSLTGWMHNKILT